MQTPIEILATLIAVRVELDLVAEHNARNDAELCNIIETCRATLVHVRASNQRREQILAVLERVKESIEALVGHDDGEEWKTGGGEN